MSTLRNLAFSFGISGLSIFASNLSATNSTDRIIGTNDLKKVPASSAMDPHIQAIGLMDLGCTVTHVGNGIAITAGHCFARSNFRGVAKNRPCDDEQYSIQWGHVEGVPSYLTSHCTQILRMELNSERDYAIFTVNPIPPTSMEVSTVTAATGTDISIYSHPKKRTMEWSNWCKVEGLVPVSKDNQFFYSCDTEPGSSGAAVLDAENKVVGIHNYYNGQLGGNRLEGRNGATYITSTGLQAILNGDVNASSEFGNN